MKSTKYILSALLLSGMVLASCSDNVEDTSIITPTEMTEASLKDGETVDILLHRKYVATFAHPVKVAAASKITLNGKPVEGVTTDVCTLTIPLKLEPSTDYTLSIGAGALQRFREENEAVAPYDVHFKTQAAPVVAEGLINPNASANARKVYSLLRSLYGKNTLSGAMGTENWKTDYYDYVTGIAGKAPAVIGFDYIHLADSPADWIDYGDITPVKNAWEAGAIPAITWHWSVPRTNKKGSKRDFNISKFSPAESLKPGTWENEYLVADIAKLAGYMKLLADQDIPVIFRPFHEAAGDYANGPWFWWGADGTEVTKQLWDYLYNELTNVHHLNNIIWEWTVQTSDGGSLASVETMKNAYVGNDKCDLVGVDLYNDNDLFSDFDCWYAVRNVVDGKKMVALSECGKLPDVSSAIARGDSWLYFMQWYEKNGETNKYEVINYSAPEIWKQVTDMPETLGRDDLKKLLK